MRWESFKRVSKAISRRVSIAIAVAIFTCGMATAQINPYTQIRWPANCSAAGMVYSLELNSCIVNGTGGGLGFASITSGTNTQAAMLVGTGASLAPTSTGTVTANQFDYTQITNQSPSGEIPFVNVTNPTVAYIWPSKFYLEYDGTSTHNQNLWVPGNIEANSVPQATSGANQNSPVVQVIGSFWSGSAAANDSWAIQNIFGSGSNPTSTLTLSHAAGGTSGAAAVSVPSLIDTALGSSTSPVCPNGTGGALTISGCMAGSTVNVNGTAVSNPNFNGTTPAAGTNGLNVTYQVSGSNVSSEIVGDGNAAHYLSGTGVYSSPAATFAQQHEFIFSSAGTLSYTHNLGTQYPQYSCITKSGTNFSPTWMTWTDANNMSMTAPSATDVICSFGANTAATATTLPPTCQDSSGSGTAQSCTSTPLITVAANACIAYSTTTSNSGTALTINVNASGAKPVAIFSGGAWTTTLTTVPSSIVAGRSYLSCYDGTDWDVQTPVTSGGGGFAFSSLPAPPAVSSFTWANQGTATATNPGTAISLVVPSTSTLNWRLLYVSQPSTPYRVESFISEWQLPYNTSASDAGLYLYDGIKLEGFEDLFLANAHYLRVEHITNVSTDGSTVWGSNATPYTYYVSLDTNGMYLGWCNDGTNLYAEFSTDGITWASLYSEAVGSFITPADVGFGGVSENSSSLTTYGTLKGWKTTSVASCP